MMDPISIAVGAAVDDVHTDMLAWLLEQITEDEAHAEKDLWAAEQATAGTWTARYGFNLSASWIDTDNGPVAKFDGSRHQADCLLAARFKPLQVARRARQRLADRPGYREEWRPDEPQGGGTDTDDWFAIYTGTTWRQQPAFESAGRHLLECDAAKIEFASAVVSHPANALVVLEEPAPITEVKVAVSCPHGKESIFEWAVPGDLQVEAGRSWAGAPGAGLGQTLGNTPVETGRSDGPGTGSDQRERTQNGRSEH